MGLVLPFGYGKAFPDWVDVPAPAAGAETAFTVDGGYAIRLLAARSILTTDANVANRSHTVDYVDARGNVRVRNGAGLVVTASTSAQGFEWSSSRAIAEWASNTPIYAPLFPAILPPGFTIRFEVTNMQAGDQLSGLSLYVERFPTGPGGFLTGAGVDAPGD